MKRRRQPKQVSREKEGVGGEENKQRQIKTGRERREDKETERSEKESPGFEKVKEKDHQQRDRRF